MISRSCIAVVMGLAVAGGPLLLQAGPAQWDGLVNNSPFGGRSAAVVNEAATGTPEFRGVVEEDGVLLFSLYDPDALVSTWVALHETGHPFTVRHYDNAGEVLTLEYRGQQMPLQLKRARAAGGSLAAAELPKVVPVAEVARLAVVAEEVQRRREMRLRSAPGLNRG